MAKAWLGTIIFLVFFWVAYQINLFGFLAGRAVFYVAIVILLVALAAAFIILGNPLARNKKDDGNDK